MLLECGNYFLSAGPELDDFYQESLDMMEKTAPEFRRRQFIKGDPAEEERLRKLSPKWVEKLHVVDKINGGVTNGFIDTKGGVTIADKVTRLLRDIKLELRLIHATP